MNTPPLDYAPPYRWRPTRRQVRLGIISLLASPLILFVLFDLGCGFEGRSVLWPSIDTVYAPGYSEGAFRTIRAGMTRRQVDAIMCKPLFVHRMAGVGYTLPDAGYMRYSYTRDGRCPWGDFAWLGREVRFQDGVVVEVFSDLYYD